MSMADLSDYRDFYSGLIRMRMLHHGAQEAIFGLGMIEEPPGTEVRISLARPPSLSSRLSAPPDSGPPPVRSSGRSSRRRVHQRDRTVSVGP